MDYYEITNLLVIFSFVFLVNLLLYEFKGYLLEFVGYYNEFDNVLPGSFVYIIVIAPKGITHLAS